MTAMIHIDARQPGACAMKPPNVGAMAAKGSGMKLLIANARARLPSGKMSPTIAGPMVSAVLLKPQRKRKAMNNPMLLRSTQPPNHSDHHLRLRFLSLHPLLP